MNIGKRLAQSAVIFIMLITNLAAGPFQPAAQPAQAAPQAVVGQNSASFLGARPGGAFTPEYVSVAYNDPSLESFSAITLEAWVKRNDASRSESILCNDHIRSYCLFFSGGNLSLNLNFGALVFNSTGTVPAGIWTHVAATYNGNTVRLYLNGMLDSSFTYFGGVGKPLAGTPLGIGVDLGSDYNVNYFDGLINNVRLWNFARTGNDIRSGMFTVTNAATSSPKPVAEWRLAGDVLDYANTFGFDGTANAITYSNDGALPHDIRIPLVSASPTLDGSCDPTIKYSGAIELTDSNSIDPTNVYLMRTASDLWVCFNNLTSPTTGHDNWVDVYLDPAFARHSLSQATDYSLEVHNNSTTLTRVGNGVGDYSVSSALNGQWSGIYLASNNGLFTTYTAEFRISNSIFGGPGAAQVGLALAQHWITGPGDDRMWPALAAYNSPQTWSAATLSGPGTARTFGGQILYEPRVYNAPMTGIGGVQINLVGYDSGGTSSIVASAKSNVNGFYAISSTDSYSAHRLEVVSVPQGLSPDLPQVSPPGSIDGPLSIDFGTAPGPSLGGANFMFLDPAPVPLDSTLSQHLLIITSQAIANHYLLNYYLNFKRAQGFTVEVAAVESIQATSPGANLMEKIRNFEIARRTAIGSSFKYVLLIGSNATIPFGMFNGGAEDANFCLNHANDGWPSEWFYVDLTSNWDTNGNGCYGDGIFGDKSTQAANHYTPDASGTLFQNTVSLGRIPIDDPNSAINALFHSMQFEMQNGDFKSKALLASSMMDVKTGSNACWLPPDDPHGAWYSAGGHTVNNVDYGCDFMSGTGTDGSYLSNFIRTNILDHLGFHSTQLFENASPITGASPYKSATPLSEANIKSALSGTNYGFVQLMGHGNGDGVFRLVWNGDANGDGAVNNPTQPIGPQSKSVYELDMPVLASRYTGLGNWGSSAPIFIVASCSTGQYNQADSFGASLLANGQGVAWVGGTGVVPYSGNWTQLGGGGIQDIAFKVSQLLLTGNFRLGDALWQVMHDYMAQMQSQGGGWWAQDFDLYGDPTITFFGNGGADAVGSPWPMLRNNSAGLGYTSLSGPVQPKQLWSYPANARVLETLKPSPLVTSSNDVVASYFNFVDVIRGGTQKAHMVLSAPVFGSPALADDGTIYAVTIGGLLYAFSPTGAGGSYVQRWTLDMGAVPTTSPIIGPDGFISIGHQGSPTTNVTVISSSGSLFHDMALGGGEPVGAIAIAHDRSEYIATTAGGLVKLNFCSASGYCTVTITAPSAFSTPPLIANNSVYVGRADGTIVRYNPTTLATLASFTADSGIVVGPILGPSGQILVGTQSGTFYSLSIGLTLRWQKGLGAGAINGQPAFTANGLYVANGDFLEIYDPASGVRNNLVFLATGAGGGTVAAGYNRHVFVQTALGPIVAVGEGWLPPIDQLHSGPILTSDPAGGPNIKSILVTWSLYVPPPLAVSPAAVNTAAGILVQRSLLGGPWEDLAVLPLGATQYNDLSVQPGADYSYRLQVLDSTGNDSDFTNTPDVHSYPNLPSAPAISAVAADGAASLHITWSNTLNAGDAEVSSYRLERAALATGPFTAVATLPQASTSYEDTGLAAGTPYFYRLFASNSTGDSLPSAVLSGTTDSLTLTAPQNLILSNPSAFNYQLSWTGAPATPGALAIIEQQVEGQAGFTQIGSMSAAGPFSFEQVNPGFYQYRVKFVVGNTESDYTTTFSTANVANFTPNIASTIFLPVVKK